MTSPDVVIRYERAHPGELLHSSPTGHEVLPYRSAPASAGDKGPTSSPTTSRAKGGREELTEIEFEEVSLDHPLAWTTPYEVAQISVAAYGVPMYEPSAAGHLDRVVLEIDRAEGPVSEEVALRRARAAWGAGRSGARIRQAFDASVARLSRQAQVRRSKGFLSVPGKALQVVRTPSHGNHETRRDAAEVPPEELQLAIQQLVADARSISLDELTQSVARIFGWGRRGSDIGRALNAAVAACIRKGEIMRDGDLLRAPHQ